MIVQVRVVQEKIVEVDYDGRRTDKFTLQSMFESGELRASDDFVFTNNRGYTTRVVSVGDPQVEVLQ